MTDLGHLIKTKREEMGWSQADLADAVSKIGSKKISQTTISAIERGKTREPEGDTLKAIAQVLGVKASSLRQLASGALDADEASNLTRSASMQAVDDALNRIQDEKKRLRIAQFITAVADLPEDDIDLLLSMASTMLHKRYGTNT